MEQALLLATEAMKEDSSKAIQAEGELRKILERELVAEKKKVNELQQEVLDLKEVTKVSFKLYYSINIFLISSGSHLKKQFIFRII